MRERVRLLVTPDLHPYLNMALDQTLAPEPFTVRFYSFDPPGLSLGYFQSAAHFPSAALRRFRAVLVRRVTGGAAILHDRDITFSLIGRADHPTFAGDIKASYARIHAAVAFGLSKLGVATEPRDEATPRSDSGRTQEAACFLKASSFDLVAGARKLVGSAQRRTPGRVLHHGSIPLVHNALAPEASSLERELGRSIAFPEAEEALERAFAESFSWDFDRSEPTAREIARAQECVATQFGTSEWNERV